MSNELVNKLWSWSVHSGDPLFAQAAEEIERLEKKVQLANKNQDLVPIYIPKNVIEREVTNSYDLVDEDLQTIHKACIETWNSLGLEGNT